MHCIRAFIRRRTVCRTVVGAAFGWAVRIATPLWVVLLALRTAVKLEAAFMAISLGLGLSRDCFVLDETNHSTIRANAEKLRETRRKLVRKIFGELRLRKGKKSGLVCRNAPDDALDSGRLFAA